MMYGYFKEVKTMIDKNDPEIQAYLKEELQNRRTDYGTDSVEKCQITAWWSNVC